MGLDILAYIEVRRDGRWDYVRPEPPHVLPGEFYRDRRDSHPVPLLCDQSHTLFDLLRNPDPGSLGEAVGAHAARRGLPPDVSPALSHVGRSYAGEPPPGWLTPRELQEELSGYASDIDEVIAALQGLGRPDDVRVVYEFVF